MSEQRELDQTPVKEIALHTLFPFLGSEEAQFATDVLFKGMLFKDQRQLSTSLNNPIQAAEVMDFLDASAVILNQSPLLSISARSTYVCLQ